MIIKPLNLSSAAGYLHRNDLSTSSICSEPGIALGQAVTLKNYLTFEGNEGKGLNRRHCGTSAADRKCILVKVFVFSLNYDHSPQWKSSRQGCRGACAGKAAVSSELTGLKESVWGWIEKWCLNF